MHGLEDFVLYALLGCMAVAFLVEFIINRRPFVIAFAVPTVLFAISCAIVALDGSMDDFLVLFAIFGIGGVIGSLMGSGMARALRLWIEMRRDSANSEE